MKFGKNSNDFEVDITPSVTTYELYQIASYTHWFSIGEFIDNAITSAMQNWDSLKSIYGKSYELNINIDLDFENSTLTILDNAGGIKKSEIERALRAGEPPADTNWLSVHGVGMKMSSFWWGRNLKIETWPLEDKQGYQVVVDLDEIKESRSAQIAVHQIEKAQPSGTLITISRISEDKWPKGTALGKLKNLLTSMYRVYINNSDKRVNIIFNGKRMEFKSQPILEAPYWNDTSGPSDEDSKIWEREFEFTTSRHHKIYGHVGLLAKMSRDLSGFFLHYKGKGMGGIGYSDASDAEFSKRDLKDSREYYRPEKVFGQEGSYRYQRFTGEFDISDLGKTASTDSIKWDSDEEEEFLEALVQFLKDPNFNMWAMAQNFQQRKAIKLKNDPHDGADTEISIDEFNEIAKNFFNPLKEERIHHLEDGNDLNDEVFPIGIPLSSADADAFEDGEIFVQNDKNGHSHFFRISYLEDPDYELLNLVSDDSHNHTIQLNTAHPWIRKMQWGNKDVREAVISTLFLAATVEAFLGLRNDRSAFRLKINELADSPRDRVPNELKDNE
jgi:hypothetical protein